MGLGADTLAIFLYAVAVSALLVDVIRRQATLRKYAIGVLVLGFTLHTYALITRFSLELGQGNLPATGASENFHILSWVFVAIVLLLQAQSRLSSIASFLAVFGLISGLTALFAPNRSEAFSPHFPRFLFATHIGVLVLGMGSLCLSSLTALVYLLKNRELKLKRFGTLLTRFPALETLDLITMRTLFLGVVALTLGMSAGILIAHSRYSADWPTSPKFIFSVATFVWYVGLILLRRFLGWRGSRFFLLVGIGFLILGFTYVGITIFFPAVKMKEISELSRSGPWNLLFWA